MDFKVLFSDLDISISGGKLIIEGKRYTLSDFRKDLMELVNLDTKEGLELMKIKATDSHEYKSVTKDIYDSIKRDLTPTVEYGLDSQNGLGDLTPVTSLEEDEVLLVDEEKGTVLPVNYKSWLRGLDVEHRKIVQNTAMPIAKFFFDPYDFEKRVLKREVGGLEVYHINTYTPPLWRQEFTANEYMPPMLDSFLTHLIPDAAQRDYCLEWMAEAVFGRNETYLVLNGDKGVGKNTIYEIMKAVIGAPYCVTAPASLTTSHFNSVLKDRRLILLDEYKITRSNHLFLKKIINKNQTIERKGVDADKEIETFNNFMVFHNDVSDMYLEKDDRRFSVLDLTNRNLIDVWTPEEIGELIIELNKPESELVKQIGEFLAHVHENTEFNNMIPYKGNRFHEIVEYHMPTWLQIVVAMVENGDVVDGEISFKKEIEKRLATEMMGKKKIQWRKSTLDRTLKEYKYKGTWILGTIEKDGKGLVLKINPDLLEQFDHYGTDAELEEEDDLL